jgi:hypothetical protein
VDGLTGLVQFAVGRQGVHQVRQGQLRRDFWTTAQCHDFKGRAALLPDLFKRIRRRISQKDFQIHHQLSVHQKQNQIWRDDEQNCGLHDPTLRRNSKDIQA